MYYGKRQLYLTAVAAVMLGMLLHRLYGWFPGPGTALVSLVRESIWEHEKILFWPLLLSGLWLTRGRPGGLRPWLLGLDAVCILMLPLAYIWHLLEGPAWGNVALYVLLIALGFRISTRFGGPFTGRRWLIPPLIAAALGILMVLFTLWPPEGRLFMDLTAAGVWYELPC